MLEHLQPGFVTPKILYRGARQRVRPVIWATDQGVPNEDDPNPSQSDIHVPIPIAWHDRVRPQPWKRAQDEEEVRGPKCLYEISFVFQSEENDGQAIYTQKDADAVCYYGNPTVGPLGYTGGAPVCLPPPPIIQFIGALISGFTVPINFRCWWNIATVCGAAPADTSAVDIFNSGTCNLNINGSTITPGNSYHQAGIDFDPANGDESGYVGGSNFTVTPI